MLSRDLVTYLKFKLHETLGPLCPECLLPLYPRHVLYLYIKIQTNIVTLHIYICLYIFPSFNFGSYIFVSSLYGILHATYNTEKQLDKKRKALHSKVIMKLWVGMKLLGHRK